MGPSAGLYHIRYSRFLPPSPLTTLIRQLICRTVPTPPPTIEWVRVCYRLLQCVTGPIFDGKSIPPPTPPPFLKVCAQKAYEHNSVVGGKARRVGLYVPVHTWCVASLLECRRSVFANCGLAESIDQRRTFWLSPLLPGSLSIPFLVWCTAAVLSRRNGPPFPLFAVVYAPPPPCLRLARLICGADKKEKKRGNRGGGLELDGPQINAAGVCRTVGPEAPRGKKEK